MPEEDLFYERVLDIEGYKHKYTIQKYFLFIILEYYKTHICVCKIFCFMKESSIQEDALLDTPSHAWRFKGMRLTLLKVIVIEMVML